MPEIFLRLLADLPHWDVYRQVAAVIGGEDLAAWRRLYESRPTHDILLREASRILRAEAQRRYPDVIAYLDEFRQRPAACRHCAAVTFDIEPRP
jgi:hypothetical protein